MNVQQGSLLYIDTGSLVRPRPGTIPGTILKCVSELKNKLLTVVSVVKLRHYS